MNDKASMTTKFAGLWPGLLIGLAVPLVTDLTLGFDHALWQTAAIGALVGGIVGLAYRLLVRK